LLKTNMFNHLSIKHKQMSFVSNGGKFKLYTVLLFSTPTQPRFSFERLILIIVKYIYLRSLNNTFIIYVTIDTLC
jgi:hypothetical protein